MASNRFAHLAQFAAALLLASTTLTAGCQVARVQEPLTRSLDVRSDDGQMEFWHRLAERPLASNEEATAALLLFGNEQDVGGTYEERVAKLKAKGWLPDRFNAPADEAVKRGTVAYALCKALNIRGGLTMAVFGTHERYAVRELIDRELFPTSSPDQTFSGTELVGVFGKAEDYQRGGGGEKTPGGLAENPR